MLDTLPKEAVRQNLELHKQFILENTDDTSVLRGPFHDTVLYYSALFATHNQQQIAEAMKPLRIGKLLKEPETASTELVNTIASNWMIERQVGAKASGLLTLIFPRHVSMAIPAGTEFRAGGKVFRTPDTYTVRSQGGSVLANDRILREHNEGWTVSIPVVATEIGTGSNVRKGTPFRSGLQHAHIKRAFAAEDFKGGCDAESNRQVLKRLLHGTAGKVLSNRVNIEAFIATMHPTHVSSIIGFGDPELLRDKDKSGGRVDLYVRTTPNLITRSVSVVGTPVGGDLWDIVVPRHVAAGMYEVLSVYSQEGVAAVVSDVRDCDLTDIAVDVTDSISCAYSSVQIIKLRVRSKSGPTFLVEMRGVPDLLELQEAVLRPDIRNPGGDLLVKAPVPCYVTTQIEIQRISQNIPIAVELLRDNIATTVNTRGFAGTLPSASIAAAAIRVLDGAALVRRIQLSAVIRCPDGKEIQLQNEPLLTIPNKPELLVTPRTVLFVQEPSAVQIRLTTVDGF